MKRSIISFIIIVLALVPQLQQFVSSGFFPMHDDTQVARVVAMGKALRNGQFPVRWVSDLGYGYGYPIFNFYGPLPYYVGGVLYAFGVSGIAATKVMIVIGILLLALVMYYCSSLVFGSVGGVIAAVAYVYMPYHSVQLYVRGSIGEYWATIFLPLVAVGIHEALRKKYRSATFIIGLGLAGTILSHTLLGYATFILLAIFVCSYLTLLLARIIIDRKVLYTVLFGILIGLGLTAFFWLPALTEMKYTSVRGQVSSSADFRDHFVCLSQLWSSPWGFGGSQPGCEDGMSFGLGKAFLLITLISFLNLLIRVRYLVKMEILILSVGILLLSVFFLLPTSVIFWEYIPQFDFLQYPWRFLAFTMVGMAFIIGGISYMTKDNKAIRFIIGIIVVLIIVWQGSKWSTPQYIYIKPIESFESLEELRFRASKVSDEYLSPDFIKPKSIDEIAKSTIINTSDSNSKQVIDKETYKKFEFNPTRESSIILQHAHFPGWIYIVNGGVQPLKLQNGRPVITIPKEFSTAEMKFTNTLPRIIGNLISTIFVIVLVYIYGKKTIT